MRRLACTTERTRPCLPGILCALLLIAGPSVVGAESMDGEAGKGEALVVETRDEVGRYIYWDEGIRLTKPGADFSLKVGGKINYDLGEVDADNNLQAAFPGLDGFHSGFRRLTVALLGRWERVFEFKVEVDIDELGDVKDNWIHFLKGPVLPHFTFGHMKEPFSMDMLTGGDFTTFMEFSLPTRAFGPFRNIGVTSHGTWKDERVTWAAGFFLNTGSFNDIGSATERISEANGYNLTGRLTWLPWFDEEARRLVHLGLSYSHRSRDIEVEDPDLQLRSRPESRLTDDRLVDTGRLNAGDGDVISIEAAAAQGPFSLQGEYFHLFQDVGETVEFSGWYLQGSWVLTGESKIYNTSGGIFTGVQPTKDFSVKEKGWGALELALRYSFADLNDGLIRGGEESNLSVGMNWYFTRRHRLMVNYIGAKVEDRADPPVDEGDADILMCRFQLAF